MVIAHLPFDMLVQAAVVSLQVVLYFLWHERVNNLGSVIFSALCHALLHQLILVLFIVVRSEGLLTRQQRAVQCLRGIRLARAHARVCAALAQGLVQTLALLLTSFDASVKHFSQLCLASAVHRALRASALMQLPCTGLVVVLVVVAVVAAARVHVGGC